MPTVLSLSSQVAFGHVGHSVTVFVWQRLGVQVVALPTVILSNRPDYPSRAGQRTPPEQLGAMLEALAENGWLGKIDAVFTGYLPSAEHVALSASLVRRLRDAKPSLLYCCDPILGDEPEGLYIAEDAARAVRAELIPLADLTTPNRFELGWLAGRRIASAADALHAARSLSPMTLATSSPGEGEGELVNILATGGRAWRAAVARREIVPHGTGDAMAAQFLAHLLFARTPPEALSLATGGLEAIIEASEGADELELVASQERWAAPPFWPVTEIPMSAD